MVGLVVAFGSWRGALRMRCLRLHSLRKSSSPSSFFFKYQLVKSTAPSAQRQGSSSSPNSQQSHQKGQEERQENRTEGIYSFINIMCSCRSIVCYVFTSNVSPVISQDSSSMLPECDALLFSTMALKIPSFLASSAAGVSNSATCPSSRTRIRSLSKIVPKR